MMKIEFYIQESQTIPTQLRVKVDDSIDVYYEHLPNKFGWEFKFFKLQGVTLEMAEAITDKIVSKMISQSYDHGAQWREIGVREVENDKYTVKIKVFFRVRDAG